MKGEITKANPKPCERDYEKKKRLYYTVKTHTTVRGFKNGQQSASEKRRMIKPVFPSRKSQAPGGKKHSISLVK